MKELVNFEKNIRGKKFIFVIGVNNKNELVLFSPDLKEKFRIDENDLYGRNDVYGIKLCCDFKKELLKKIKEHKNIDVALGIEKEVYDMLKDFFKKMKEDEKMQMKKQTEEELKRFFENDIYKIRVYTTGYGVSFNFIDYKIYNDYVDPLIKEFIINNHSKFETVKSEWVDYGFDKIVQIDKDKFWELFNKYKDEKIKKEKEKLEKEKLEKEKLENAYKNEIIFRNVIDGEKILLHCLFAELKKDENIIVIKDTGYNKYFKNKISTYNIKEEIKNIGGKWNPKLRYWYLENTKENIEKVKNLLLKYDVKELPSKLGLVKCWECGNWFKPNKNSYDGYGWYCGC